MPFTVLRRAHRLIDRSYLSFISSAAVWNAAGISKLAEKKIFQSLLEKNKQFKVDLGEKLEKVKNGSCVEPATMRGLKFSDNTRWSLRLSVNELPLVVVLLWRWRGGRGEYRQKSSNK